MSWKVPGVCTSLVIFTYRFEVEKVETEFQTYSRYHFVGYATVYNFYSYPAGLRPRISQFVILPTYQRFGIGKKLLFQIYEYYENDPKVGAITGKS